MYAHVTTYRLGDSSEVDQDKAYAQDTGEAVSDHTARTIASWWHSPAENSRNITALSHGRPFDTAELRDEISREITDPADSEALLTWLEALEAHLSE